MKTSDPIPGTSKFDDQTHKFTTQPIIDNKNNISGGVTVTRVRLIVPPEFSGARSVCHFLTGLRDDPGELFERKK
jgi:hypothetical protein